MQITTDELRAILAEQIDFAGGQRQWAADHGLSQQYTNDVMRGRNLISDNFASHIGIGYRRVVVWEPIGTEEEPDVDQRP